jgi:hypothetical protein
MLSSQSGFVDVTEVDERSAPASNAPWSESVLTLLRDWQLRAAVGQEAHYARATSLADYNIWFGVPVVALTTLVATSVFATLQEDIRIELRVLVGFISALAAVLASLQTFLRFQERAEKHRVSAELWAALRREIDEMLALHPDYLAERSDPKKYLDDLRRRMDEVSAQSLELGEKYMTPAQRKLTARDGARSLAAHDDERRETEATAT